MEGKVAEGKEAEGKVVMGILDSFCGWKWWEKEMLMLQHQKGPVTIKRVVPIFQQMAV